MHGNHSITFKDCYDAMKKLKHSRNDGCTDIFSDHITHACDRFAGYLDLHFKSMLCHGSSPDGMLLGTIIPLPKGKLIHLSCSDNYRAILLSSTFAKLVGYIILNKDEHELNTSELQFSFKKTHQLVYVLVCMMQETYT